MSLAEETNLEFKVTVPMEKSAYQGDDGGWYIKGVAAAANFQDVAGDIILPEAIEMLAEQINNEPVPFRNYHQVDDIKEDLGMVVKAHVTPDFELGVEIELDQDNPDAQFLWKKLSKGKKYGLSIKGNSQNPIIEKGVKSFISKHRAVLLKEVSVTTRPYYTHSLGTVLRKAISEADASLANTGENTIMADSTTGESTAQESSAPENDTAAEVSPSQEIVKSLMENEDFKNFMADTIKANMPAVETVVEESTEDSVEDSTEVEKSETEGEAEESVTTDTSEIVKSITSELEASFDAKMEAMLSRIADAVGPAVLQKSEVQEADEAVTAFKNADPRTRLRVGLAAQHGMIDRL